MQLLEYGSLFQKYFDEHYEEFKSTLDSINNSSSRIDKECEFNSFLSEHILKVLQINNITIIDENLLKAILIITETFYDEIR